MSQQTNESAKQARKLGHKAQFVRDNFTHDELCEMLAGEVLGFWNNASDYPFYMKEGIESVPEEKRLADQKLWLRFFEEKTKFNNLWYSKQCL